MKKLISLITIIALLLTFLTVFASCGGAPRVSSVEKTTYKDVINWSYDADTKTIKIESATAEPAEMPAFTQASELPWYSLRTYAVKLELSGISKISDYAFFGMYYVKEITFGSDVKEIGKCAFAFCASLVDVTLPEGVTAIGESAFEGCANLKTVNLPASLATIDARAFAYNHSLTTVKLASTLNDSLADSRSAIFEGITLPTLSTFSVNENGEAAPAPDESTETTDATEAATDAPASEDATETATDATDATETEAPDEPQDTTTTVIAIVILVLVIIGLIVGGILLARSNKKITKDSRTVRKNDPKYNKNSNSKGKKK